MDLKIRVVSDATSEDPETIVLTLDPPTAGSALLGNASQWTFVVEE